MKTLAQRLTCGLPLASASLCLAMLMTPQTMAESRILAVADFGSSPTNDTPDGCDDLLWHDFETGEVIIHYLNDDGVSVRNVIGSISDIELVSPGNGYFSSDSIVVDDEGTGGIGLAATLNVVGPIAAVTMLDAGRDYVNGEALVVTNPEEVGGSDFSAIILTADGGVGAGQVAKVKVADGGRGYTPGSALALIALPPNGDINDAAIATVFVGADGTVQDEDSATPPLLVESGTGFITTPQWTISGDQPVDPANRAVIQAVLFGGIDSVFILDSGNGYTGDPEFQVGDGSNGALADFATSRGPGQIESVTVTQHGRNYALAPTVSVESEAGGIGASFTVPINLEGPGALTSEVSDAPLLVGGPGWQATGGDLDGDGDNDIIWRHAGRQETHLWFMEGGKQIDAGLVPANAAARWKIIGTGDFDNDGDDEIYWFDRLLGRSAIWDIDYVPGQPDQWLGPKTTYAGWVPNRDWAPFAIQDITEVHDGPEILWGNMDNGAVAIRMRNPQLMMSVQHAMYARTVFGERAHAGEGWFPKHQADMDANGRRDDIFWHNQITGDTAVWRMSLNVLIESDAVRFEGAPANTNYTPVGIGHFSPEPAPGASAVHHANIFWRQNFTHNTVSWQMDRTQGGGGSAAADDVHNSVGDYDDTTPLTRPYSIFQAILLDVQGITQILTRPADGGNGGGNGGDLDGGDGGGNANYDINTFVATNPATWPEGVNSGDEMIAWIGQNVSADDPNTWPDSVTNEAEFENWLIQTTLVLASL